MQRLEVSAAVRHIYVSLGFKRLMQCRLKNEPNVCRCYQSHTTHPFCDRLLSGSQFRPRVQVIIRSITQESECSICRLSMGWSCTSTHPRCFLDVYRNNVIFYYAVVHRLISLYIIFISHVGEHKFLLVNLALYQTGRIILNFIFLYIVHKAEIIPQNMKQPVSV